MALLAAILEPWNPRFLGWLKYLTPYYSYYIYIHKIVFLHSLVIGNILDLLNLTEHVYTLKSSNEL